MQNPIKSLDLLGSFPSSESADIDTLAMYEKHIEQITEPLTSEEVRILVGLFGQDDYFGLAWKLVHLIETASSWPLVDCLRDSENEWIKVLKQRSQ